MYVALCTKLGSGHTFITSYDDIQVLIDDDVVVKRQQTSALLQFFRPLALLHNYQIEKTSETSFQHRRSEPADKSMISAIARAIYLRVPKPL